MQTVRCVVRARRTPGALLAVVLAVSCLVLSVPAMQASASDIQHQASGTNGSDTRTLAISITGMTPQVARPGNTVTVTGTLANHTGSAISGITVQAQTSTVLFNGRAEMASFTANGSYPSQLLPAGTPETTRTVSNGATVRWSVSFPAATFYHLFGVFPLQVRAVAPRGGYTAAARTFLPFWPGGTASSQPQQLQVAWIWPLVDTPQQGACTQTLATSRLAGSVASGGRLSTLLGAGATWAQDDQLTWNIDPALLSDVSVMTRQYFTPGNAACTGRFTQKASPAASEWLTRLRTATAGQPAFLTPYANVDVAALSHARLDASIRTAYQLGDTVAGQILPQTFGASSGGTGDGSVRKTAWPADGLADAGVVTSLRIDGGITTVVLSSGCLCCLLPLLRRLGGGSGLRLLLLLHERRDLTLFLGQRTLLGLYGLRILRHGVLLGGHLRLGLRLLALELSLLRVQRLLGRVEVVDGERDVAFGDLVVFGGRTERLFVAAEDWVLGRRGAIRDVVGHGRLGEGGLVLGHLLLVRRHVGLGCRDARIDLRQLVLRLVVLLAQRRHLVLGLGQLRLDGGGLGLGVRDGVTDGGARCDEHSA